MNLKNILKNPLLLVLLLTMAVFATRDGRFSDPLGWVIDLLYRVPGLIIGITIHEYAHAKSANMLGDPTPKIQGRISLNPVRHFDIFGLMALIFIGFGWGKPVIISPYYFKNKRRDGFIVAIAGVATNFIAAFIFTGILVYMSTAVGITGDISYQVWSALFRVVSGIVVMNLALMIFNFLPVPPLDGFNMLTELLDLRKYDFWYTIYNWGFPILIVLIMLGVTSRIMGPALDSLFSGLVGMWSSVFGLFV